MLVDIEDATCRQCGGQLQITGADDVSLDANCTECGESIHVEVDYFGDGGIRYWPEVMPESDEEL